MGEIVNLRRAKKAKARTVKENLASENRAKFGAPKAARELTEARRGKEQRALDAHKRDDKD